MTEYFVLSIKHTKKTDAYISLWRPGNAGYCWPLPWAGIYTYRAVDKEPDYYNNGTDTIAVHWSAAVALVTQPRPGTVDGDVGPVILNTKENWKKLRNARLKVVE